MTNSTIKKYYEAPYVHDFEAKLLSLEKISVKGEKEETVKFEAVLDHTYFYPEGGGQLSDCGKIAGASIEFVYEKKDVSGNIVIRHRLSEAPSASMKTGETVKCSVDFFRRFQNMQDHSGQHILSESFIRTADLHTVSMHMGSDFMTIDLAVPGAAAVKNFKLDKYILDAAEDMANSIIYKDIPVKTFMVKKEELSNYKLRKTPELEDEYVRIVQAGDFDTSLCCGTHVSRAGEIGVIKIIGQEKVQSGARIKFLCGARALADYRAKTYMINEIAESMSVKAADLKKTVERLEAENKNISKTKSELFEKYYAKLADELASGKNIENGIYYEVFDETPYQEIARAGQIFSKSAGRFSFIFIKPELSGENKVFRFVIGKTPSYEKDVKSIFNEIIQKYTVKGGGSPLVVQGGNIDMAALEEFKAFVSGKLAI